MDYSLIFNLTNLVVMPFWLLMILLPHWRWTRRICGSLWIVVPPALIYAGLIIPWLPAVAPMLVNPQLEALAPMIGTPNGMTIAWAHFVAFDLFVGRWAYLESRRLGITAWLASPALVVILLAGPLGLLLFLALRAYYLPRAQSAA